MDPRLALLTAALVAALLPAPAHAAVDLTGTWAGSDSSTYDVQQSGTSVRWNGRSNDGKHWNHDFTGSLDGTGRYVSGNFQDRPGYGVYQKGTVKVFIDNQCRMSFVSASTGWGTRIWTKQGCAVPPPPSPPPPPPAPEEGLTLDTVANGCGGDFGEHALRVQNYIGNTSVYSDSTWNPLAKRYPVNFKPACDLHDAGYSGVDLIDVKSGFVLDFSNWSRKRVDKKFLRDMQKICKRRIPKEATVARQKCLGTGGLTSIGADHRYQMVRDIGMHLFDADPGTPGRQAQGPRRNN